MQSYWKSKGLSVLLLICSLWLPSLALAATETVILPVTLEYPFIRSVLVYQLYNAPGERAIVIDEAQGDCIHIELSNPEVSREQSLIKVGSNIKIRAGVPILGTCVGHFEWEGHIEVLERLVIDENSWRARFETIDSRLYDTNRKPSTIAGRLWNLIKAYVHPYLSQTNIELAPPLQEVKTFLPLVFLPEERKHVDHWLDTLRLGPVEVEESAVKVNLLMEVQTQSKPRTSTAQLSLSEIEHLSRAWEDWDAFLVFEIESLIGQPITDMEGRAYSRYYWRTVTTFSRSLNQKTIGTELVQQQFVRTWQRLPRSCANTFPTRHHGPLSATWPFSPLPMPWWPWIN